MGKLTGKFKRKLRYALNILSIVCLALGGIAIYNLITDGASSLLNRIGVHQLIWQNLILLGTAILLLALSGVRFLPAIRKLLKG